MDNLGPDTAPFKAASSQKFFEEWLQLRGDQKLTTWEAFSAELSGELMLYMFINEWVDGDLTIRFMGSELVSIWGNDLTGLSATAAAGPDFAQDLLRRAEIMFTHPCGSLENVWSTTATHKRILTEGLYLPLAHAAGRPQRMASHMAFIETPQHDFDSPTQIRVPHQEDWIDLGFGVPGN